MSNRSNTMPSSAQRHSHHPTLSTSEYKDGVRQADEILRENDLIPPDENWQETVLHWFVTEDIERKALAAYMTEHQEALGAAWAREMLRMEIFFQVDDHVIIVAHYDRTLSQYPRCIVLDMWVADHIFRHQGDFWRARPMYQDVQEHLPQHPKPYYELGFMNHLLGDLPSALEQFNRAAERIDGYNDELAARVFYNRGVTRYALEKDRKGAIADLKKALEYKPNYPQAKKLLRGLSIRSRLPW